MGQSNLAKGCIAVDSVPLSREGELDLHLIHGA